MIRHGVDKELVLGVWVEGAHPSIWEGTEFIFHAPTGARGYAIVLWW